MQFLSYRFCLFLVIVLAFPLNAYSLSHFHGSLPRQITSPGEKIIIVDPNIHRFGAYSAAGSLQHAGMVSAGSNWCRDLHRPCRTRSGTFRIYSLGSAKCFSHKFPLPHGGAPMPYCMYFNGSQALHGSYEVVNGNISHGCVRLHVADAKWLRFNFVDGPNAANQFRGTRVIVRPY